MKRILVTYFSGPLGYQLSRHFRETEIVVDGVDSFLPDAFKKAPPGSKHYQRWLDRQAPGLMHYELNLSRREGVMELIREIRPSAIIHSLPPRLLESAGGEPLAECDLILSGTLNLLEAMRSFCWESPFIFLTSDKVYGDRTNTIPLDEKENRWDFAESAYRLGIPEEFPIDHSTHSIFGAAAAAADLLVQEYGRSFLLPTCCLRGPAPTDPWNPDVALYDLLGRLVQASLRDEECPVPGHGLKQVREALHACDVAKFIELFCAHPRAGEVYNLGGGRENSYSVLEASRLIEEKTNRPLRVTARDEIPAGDHICYFSDPGKIQRHYPGWRVTRSLAQIIEELVEAVSPSGE